MTRTVLVMLEKIKYAVVLLVCLLSVVVADSSNELVRLVVREQPKRRSRADAFMMSHWQHLLQSARDGIVEAPAKIVLPGEKFNTVRQQSLLLFDAVLHVDVAPEFLCVQTMFKENAATVARELKSCTIKKGVKVWKLYNMGFVVKSADATIGFDLVRAEYMYEKGFVIDYDVMQEIIDECDILFVSHFHGDHADSWVANRFLEAGKIVVAPEPVWEEMSWHNKVTHLKRDGSKTQKLDLPDSKLSLTVRVYPGHQGGNIENNVSFVTLPNGICVGQTGDQYNKEDLAWIDTVAKSQSIDVLLLNCWAYEFVHTVDVLNPGLLVIGHENEMGHRPFKREPFWRSLDKVSRIKVPHTILTWGESIEYTRKKH